MELDRFQVDVRNKLDLLAHRINRLEKRRGRLRSLIRHVIPSNTDNCRGMYIWGGVGRGKTMLMDRFFGQLSTERRIRTHFHSFMRDVHEELTELTGTSNPLEKVAERIHVRARVVCLDEFFVSDIGDAMILGELLRELFERQVVLVSTSNIRPADLYENGLQRRRFLPAIELLRHHNEVVHLDGNVDYRLRSLLNRDLYRIDLRKIDELIAEDIEEITGNEKVRHEPLLVNKREIETLYQGEGVVGILFRELCETARNASDYIEVARTHHTVVVYDIPVLSDQFEEAARRFISFVDIVYDHNVNLILHSTVGIQELYRGEMHAFEFDRTRSRIVEMASTEYLSKAHRA